MKDFILGTSLYIVQFAISAVVVAVVLASFNYELSADDKFMIYFICTSSSVVSYKTLSKDGGRIKKALVASALISLVSSLILMPFFK